ncbi:MAG: hypothetical protein OEM02_17380 [Desulfobulbaceae bacterium]|nr:hypothetical protein [Desulfobulbaceae bacterium]
MKNNIKIFPKIGYGLILLLTVLVPYSAGATELLLLYTNDNRGETHACG